MRSLSYSKRFKKSLKRYIRSGNFNLNELQVLIQKVWRGERLEERYQNHKLSGVFEGYSECHIRPDLLLIYHIDMQASRLTIFDIGSHSELFG